MEFLKSRLQSENRKKIKMPGKDQLLILLLSGILLVVIAIPTDGGKKRLPGFRGRSGRGTEDSDRSGAGFL